MSDAQGWNSPPKTLEEFLARLSALGTARTVEEVRARTRATGPLLNNDPSVSEEVLREKGITVLERVALEPSARHLDARVLLPRGDGSRVPPVMVFLHGGGWITGSTQHYRRLLARSAERGFIVVAPEYRLAPEHPFPQPLEDAAAALAWASRQEWASNMRSRVIAETKPAGSATNPIVLCGDSAGGNLAASLVLAMGREVDALVLLYPVLDLDDWLSAWPEDDRPLGMLGRDGRRLMGESYLGASPSPELRANAHVSPLRAAVTRRCPATLVLCGGADPLVRQAQAMKRLLDIAGVPSELLIEPEMPHGFVQCELQPHAMRAIDAASAFAHVACERVRGSYTGGR